MKPSDDKEATWLDVAGIQARLRRFANERDWNQFHTPKNLAMALAGEAGELLEVFQWLTPEQSKHVSAEDHLRVEEEIADILIYLLRLADEMQISLSEATDRKIERNAERYPVEMSKGRATRPPRSKP
jgi:NTP pyrophosphatase (non-canonical NTP hydrolase)